MRIEDRCQLVEELRERYAASKRKERSTLLDAFCLATGYHRKYALALLRGQQHRRPAQQRRPRSRRYGPPFRHALKVCWEASGYICSERLQPFLPELLPLLERHEQLQLTPQLRTLLLEASVATVERNLADLRPGTGLPAALPDQTGRPAPPERPADPSREVATCRRSRFGAERSPSRRSVLSPCQESCPSGRRPDDRIQLLRPADYREVPDCRDRRLEQRADGRGGSSVFVRAEDTFHRPIKEPCDAECQGQARVVLSIFDLTCQDSMKARFEPASRRPGCPDNPYWPFDRFPPTA